ncbi:hypothetical protein [Aeromicrobium sp. Leaf350]|uniref:hypothetical protein n=1 Tax=Aeromicrobium sp. Leaf350 TaxID=2876565 RepID=UPI001E499D10|nr:hypothetical protein [Aeromicrobium sp. Leaf350]
MADVRHVAPSQCRVELLDTVEDLRGAARGRLRQRVLSMTPEDLGAPAVALAPALRSRPGAATWAVVEPNGVARAIRARNFSGRRAIRDDLREIVRRRDELRVVDVADEDGRAWWIALDSRVVLVAGRVFRPRRLLEVQRDGRLALRAFSRLPADPLGGGG